MTKINCLVLFTLLGLFSCTTRSNPPNTLNSPIDPTNTTLPTKPTDDMGTDAPSLETKVFSTSTPELEIQATDIPALSELLPDHQALCPNPIEVPFSDFPLKDGFLLANKYDQITGKIPLEDFGLSSIPINNPVPQSLPEPPVETGLQLIDFKLPENGQEVDLIYSDIGRSRYEIWRISLDGVKQSLSAKFQLETLPEGDYRLLVGESKLLTVRTDLENNAQYPLSIYDWSTVENKILPELPKGVQIRNIFQLEGVFYMFLVQGSELEKIILFNLENFATEEVFTWLKDKDWANTLNTHFHIANEMFTVRVVRSDRMDLAYNLTMEEISSFVDYEKTMQPILLPEPQTMFMEAFLLSNPNGLLFWRLNFEQNTLPAYFLDFQTLTLIEYCYSIENFLMTNIDNRVFISPDHKYITITNILLGIGEEPDKIVNVEIFDPVSGQYTTLPTTNLEVVGWGRVNKP